MRILLKSALIVDPSSTHHLKKRDILIRNGKIDKIGRNLEVKASKVVEYKGLHVSPGWCDIGGQIGEPGYEHRETIKTFADAAAEGGYTIAACFPNTHPALDNSSPIEYVRNRSRDTPVEILPIGAVTVDTAGKEIAELQDMHNAGAVAFSDGRTPITHTGIMKLALHYVKTFNGLVINRPLDAQIVADGQMHEGYFSTILGMNGYPDISERIVLERDIRLLEYADSRLHVYGISSADSVTLIKNAKRSGLGVTVSVPAHNLLYTDANLRDFSTNFKVLPPLRDETARKALIQGIANGTIDAICSNHEPLEEELKKLEFANATFGSTGLQTAFAIANTALRDQVELESIIRCFAQGPRRVLGISSPVIEEGGVADLTLFDPDHIWTPTLETITSKSRNCAALNTTLRGKAIGTIYKGTLRLSYNLNNN